MQDLKQNNQILLNISITSLDLFLSCCMSKKSTIQLKKTNSLHSLIVLIKNHNLRNRIEFNFHAVSKFPGISIPLWKIDEGREILNCKAQK